MSSTISDGLASSTHIDLSIGRQTILPPLEDSEQSPPENAATLADPTSSPSTSSTPPWQRPRFHPIAEIGSGAIGQVVAARDLDIGRRVAIKRLRSDRRSEAVFLRFVQEVRTAGQLDHPNIVPIHDVGREEDGSYYIVMKYVDGETLEALIGRLRAGDPETHRAWGFERRVEVFGQILQAVRFAHDHGVLHRDLKPANVMIGGHGEVQLLDWGIAKRRAPTQISAQADTWIGEETPSPTGNETRVGAILGTPRYMAPEQARGEQADVRSKTYTLCLILFELLTLHHPRDGFTEIEPLLEAARRGALPDLRAIPAHPSQGPIPAELAWFVRDGLGLERSSRYQDVSQMLDYLQRRANGEIKVRCAATFKKAMMVRMLHKVDRHPFASWLLVLLPLLGAAVMLLALMGSVGALVAAVGVALLS